MANNNNPNIPISFDTAFVQPMMPPASMDDDTLQKNNNKGDNKYYATYSASIPTGHDNYQHQQQQSGSNSRLGLNKAASLSVISQETIKQLMDQGYPRGLAESLALVKRSFPLRIWIVDNSGSMRTTDGKRIVMNPKTLEIKLVSGCSRWSEMVQTVEYHAQLAGLINAPTVFRLLNDPGIVAGPQQFSIAQKGIESIDQDIATSLQTMSNTSPGGVTPLVDHLHEIRQNIIELLPQLRQDGTKVAIVIATDGLPSDHQGYATDAIKREFEQSLRAMEGLPVWIVIRLCTDEDNVVEYYNNIDNKLELSIEVLDDFESEAKEIHSMNPWLNYALPLHRIREMGFHNNIMDLLDEKKLSRDELRQFCKLTFGSKGSLLDESPDPDLDWNGYMKVLEKVVSNERKQWNPLRKRMEPWIDLKVLNREYNPKGNGIFSIFGF